MISDKNTTTVSLSSVIASAFYDVHKDIKNQNHTHYFLKGGRGSTKSSFVAIEIINGMMKDDKANAICYRKFANKLHDSVYENLIWAIDILKVSDYWKVSKSPLKIVYKPTGQVILFRGLDDATKEKSIKIAKGFFKYIWFEEADQFDGLEELRKVTQSLIRTSGKSTVLYTYNPPKSMQNWINAEVLLVRKDRLIHHSTYLEVPKEWLGNQFIQEAEHLKNTKEDSYNHEYLGEVTGTGGAIFTNITLRKITDEEIRQFDRIKQGIDWGYAVDPAAFIRSHYAKTHRKLFLIDEIYKVSMSNRLLAKQITLKRYNNDLTYCDSSEPKSVDEIRGYGLRALPVEKGPGSVEFSTKWLQDLEEIIIDPERCPNAAIEFAQYEYERDKNGNFKSKYPDVNNHAIDAVRYSLMQDMRVELKEENKPKDEDEQDYDDQIDNLLNY